MIFYPARHLSEYYPTMHLDGYTPTEVWIAARNSMTERLEEIQEERNSITNIKIKSEIKIK